MSCEKPASSASTSASSASAEGSTSSTGDSSNSSLLRSCSKKWCNAAACCVPGWSSAPSALEPGAADDASLFRRQDEIERQHEDQTTQGG